MPTLSFEGETHTELVQKVRRWLASVDSRQAHLSPIKAIEQGAELTKDALRIIAGSAPGPVAQNEVFKALTNMGYKATETTKQALIDGLASLDEVTGGSVVKQVQDTGMAMFYEMNATIARQILKSLTGRH